MKNDNAGLISAPLPSASDLDGPNSVVGYQSEKGIGRTPKLGQVRRARGVGAAPPVVPGVLASLTPEVFSAFPVSLARS
jgi:hypothetical protein